MSQPTQPSEPSVLLEDTKKRIEYAAKTLKVEPELVARWASADPTKNGEFIFWLAKQFKDEHLNFPDDVAMAREVLGLFAKVKNKAQFLASKDINTYTLLGDVAEATHPYSGLVSKRERRERTNEKEVVGKSGAYTAYAIMSEEAAKSVSVHWCVKDPRYFHQYNGLIFFERNGEMYALWSEQPIEFMDFFNKPVMKFEADLIRCAFQASQTLGHVIADRIARGGEIVPRSASEELAAEFPAIRRALGNGTRDSAKLAASSTDPELLRTLAAEGDEATLSALATNKTAVGLKDVPLERLDRKFLAAQESRAKAFGIDALSQRAQLVLGLYSMDEEILNDLAESGSTPVLYSMARRLDALPESIQNKVGNVFANAGSDAIVRRILFRAQKLRPPVSDRLAARISFNFKNDEHTVIPFTGMFSPSVLANIVKNTEYRNFGIDPMLERPVGGPTKELVDAIATRINATFTPASRTKSLMVLYHLARFKYRLMPVADYEKLDSSLHAPEWRYNHGEISRKEFLKAIDDGYEAMRDMDIDLVTDLADWSVADRTHLFDKAWIEEIGNYIKFLDMGLDDKTVDALANSKPEPDRPDMLPWIEHAKKIKAGGNKPGNDPANRAGKPEKVARK